MARVITPSQKKEVHLPEGLTIQQAIDSSIEEGLRDHLVVYNFGMEVTDRSFVIRRSDSLVLAVVPQGGGGGGGGKGILGALLMVALVVTAPYMAGALGFTGLGASAVTMGITMVGAMAISALVRPPDITPENSASYDQSPTYSLTGQSNQGRAYAPVMRVYGRHKVFPNLASSPIISNLGTESRISSIYDFGYGNIQVEDIRIGDTPASEFAPEFHLHTDSYVTNTVFVNRKVGYDQFQYKLIQNSPIQIRTKTKAIQFDVDISFSRGLYHFDDRGNIQNHSIDFNFQYRVVNGDWVGIGAGSVFGVSAQDIGGGNVRLSGSSARPFVAVVSINCPFSGEFEFRAVKLSADQTDSKYGEDATITMIKSFSEGTVVNLDKPHTMLEMKILASDKISGSVQNLSAIATSVLRVTDNGVNFRTEATRNPAWIAVDILTGTATPKALPDDLIDWDSWIELARHCNEMGYSSDFIVDYSTTVLELLNSVLGVARASFTMTLGGKYGCLIDVKKTVPRQLITPANSRNFGGSRSFSDRPHCFLVSYIDPALNWQKNQRPVYFDGYSELNSTIFEDLDTFGITSADEAWRFGRYMMAQGIHRAETFSVEMDIENLVVQRGDLVHVAHDVPKLGGIACRVVESSGNEITINQELSVLPTGYSVRLSDGSIRTGRVLGYLDRGRPTTLKMWEKKLSQVIPISQRAENRLVYILEGAGLIEPDDLIVMGQMDRVVNPYIVTAISPAQDLTATLDLVKYVPAVYDADTGEIPIWSPDFGDDMIGGGNLKIINLEVNNVMVYPARYPVNQIQLTWMIEGFNYHHADIYVTNPDGKSLYVGESKTLSYYQLYTILQNVSWIGQEVLFEVIPVSAGGVVGESAFGSAILFGDQTAPAMPFGFSVNIQSEQVSIFWQLSDEPDLLRYEVRFTPEFLFPDWGDSQLIGFTNWDVNRITAGARTGTYMIMAYDSSDNQSEIAYQRTSVETLPNVELVAGINDQIDDWLGSCSHLTVELVKTDKWIAEWRSLQSVKFMSEVLAGVTALCSEGEFGDIYPDGVYYFKDFLIFDEVYEVRISSYVQAHGEGLAGLKSKNTRSSSSALAYVDPSLWDCWLEYRCVAEFDFMIDWENLSNVSSLLTEDEKWSEWRVINVGDVTGRLIQFRIIVKSKSKNVKVFVTDGSVEIDVVDRIWSANDVFIPQEGKRISYDPPFMFDETAISVTIDGGSVPAKVVKKNRDRMGFDLSLKNALTNESIIGQVDILVRGQGKERNYSI
jgi:hypothetical protein